MSANQKTNNTAGKPCSTQEQGRVPVSRKQRKVSVATSGQQSLDKLRKLLAELPDNDRCIVTAEPEAITHSVGDLALFGHVWRVIKIAVRIRIRQVNCWRNDSFENCLNRDD